MKSRCNGAKITIWKSNKHRKYEIMCWKDYFDETILGRGLDYYERGAVSEMIADDDGIRAVVNGSQSYDVHIALSNGEIQEMYCDCPYAETDNCKHMAAVLYALEDTRPTETDGRERYKYYEDIERERKNKEQNTVDVLLNASEASEIKAFVREALMRDDDLRRRFLLRFSDSIDDAFINDCIKLIRKVFGRTYYRDYEEELTELDPVIDTLREITRRNKPEYAFTLATELYTAVAQWEFYPDYSYECDDYCGDLYDIADICIDAFIMIADAQNDETERLFDWLSERVDGIDGCEDDEFACKLAILFEQKFNDAEHLVRKLKIIDGIVEEYDLSYDNQGCYGSYQLSFWVKRRLSVMRSLDMDTTDYQRHFWRLSNVRIEHIDHLIEEGRITEAIDALNESILMDYDKPGLIREHTEKLKTLYRDLPDIEKYRETLWKLICDITPGSMDDYHELKALYSQDEWMIEREKVFDSLKNRTPVLLNQLYIEEGLLDRLLEWLQRNVSISNLNLYFTELKDTYPKELLDMYSDAVRRAAYGANSRQRYKELANNLRTISRLPNGKATAREIADEWRKLYKRRRAMMDELQKAGF